MPRKILPSLLVAVVIVAGGSYAGAAGYLYVKQDALIYPGVRVAEDTLHPLPENFRRLSFSAPDGPVLRGVIALPRQQAQVSPTLLLVFGGNAQDAPAFALNLRDRLNVPNLHVAAFNYRGYHSAATQASGGQPTQATLTTDALQAYDAVVADLNPGRVYLLGYSLGSAVAAQVAAERPAAGVVLVAPFAAMGRMAGAQYPWLAPVIPWLLHSPWATEDVLADSQSPVTIFHSRTDGLIPGSQAELLAHAAGDHLREITAIPHTTHGSIIHDATFHLSLTNALTEPAQTTP